MTVGEKTRSTTPRSALLYRPITTGLQPSGQVVTRARKSRADARVTAAPAVPDDIDQEEQPSYPRRTAPVQHTRTNRSAPHTHRHIHPLLFIGLGTLLMLILWVGVTQLLAWGTNE